MAFVTKTWKDRLVEYAGRRKLKNVATGEEILMDVSRSEGTVNQAGDAFSAANMNNLEQRIKTEFDSVNSSLQDSSSGESFNFGVKDGVRGFYTDPAKADDSFVPFRRGISELSLYGTSTSYAENQQVTIPNNGIKTVTVSSKSSTISAVKINNNTSSTVDVSSSEKIFLFQTVAAGNNTGTTVFDFTY